MLKDVIKVRKIKKSSKQWNFFFPLLNGEIGILVRFLLGFYPFPLFLANCWHCQPSFCCDINKFLGSFSVILII